MGLVKLTFNGANNTAKMDAYISAFLTSYENGVVNGLGDSCKYTIANGNITFSSGVISIYGRRVYVEAGTVVSVPLDSNKYGYVILNINTEDNNVYLSTEESDGAYPTLTQNNLLKQDGLYQFPMCGYIKTVSSLTADANFSINYINTLSDKVEIAKSELEKQFSMQWIKYSSYSSNVYKFKLERVTDMSRCLILVPIDSNTTVTIPGGFLKSKGSIGTCQYRLNGSDYSLTFERTSDDMLYLTTGYLTHLLNYIYIFN